ncbi:hypothetical protein HZF08_33490 [Paenibacillus sp. CGMCC 1.16610]|uniref:Uncharacterized protein n=1 Tax=Paenibacillus anseongense TaxID=2682845 RepID=A0ABW9U2K6_9BACL|nr:MULTISPECIES: hypothetical protein [Paenibacillus]MBA2943186.1 hypothetical protein [Paenibacillus sp. CGMCC 1.16610]MVQ33683.1 hypothetical protein [Paenibacillus anseongense]
MFITMLKNTGLKSGVVYATGIMKAREVISMVADFRSQETISEMTQRILRENNVPVNEEIATAANDDYFKMMHLETNVYQSIPDL